MAEFWDILDESGNKTGRLHERGYPMQRGEYHLVVHVWVMNSIGEFLISKRSPNLTLWPDIWQTTGGSAVTGDDSLETALKEANEEIGIDLDLKNGQLFKRYIKQHRKIYSEDKGGAIFDVWLFRQEVDIHTVVLQPEETCDAMWASKEKIKQMIDDGIFILKEYPYIDELFCFCDKS